MSEQFSQATKRPQKQTSHGNTFTLYGWFWWRTTWTALLASMQLVKSEHGISGAPFSAMTVSTALCRARSGQGNGHPFSRLQAGWRSIRGALACQAAAPLVTRLLSKYIYALPRQMNHQQRKPTRPATTTMTATEMPAIAPVLRPLLFVLPPVPLPLLSSFLT